MNQVLNLFGEIQFKEILNLWVEFQEDLDNSSSSSEGSNNKRMWVFCSKNPVGHVFGNWYNIIVEITPRSNSRYSGGPYMQIKEFIDNLDDYIKFEITGINCNFIWKSRTEKKFFEQLISLE